MWYLDGRVGMSIRWFQSLDEQVWHLAKVINDKHCHKCSSPEYAALCDGSEPDWPTWTVTPDEAKRCAECVSQMVDSQHGSV
jgi:hypothetical protein